jgi:outer membrane receptor protein involved in Fe transport
MHTWWLVCVAAFLCCSSPSQAAETLETAPLEPVVATASKSPQTPGNVTQKVDVITAAEIEQIVAGKGNVAELLTYEPGAFVSVLSRNDANWGSFGGLSQKYTTFMLEGLPIDAFVDPQSLEPLAFQRIERQRGPAAVLYPNYLSMDFAGNQSPLTGTTNIILKERIDQTQSRFDAWYGSYDTWGGKAYHQQAAGPLHVLFGASYEQSDYTDYGSENSWLNMIDDPEYEKDKLYLKSTLMLGADERHKLSLFVHRTAHQGDTGRPNRDFDHEYWTLNGGYSVPLGDALSGTVKFGYRDYERTWEEDSFPSSLALASENGVEQSIVPLDASLAFAHFGNSLLTVGADYQSADYKTFSEVARRVIGNDAEAEQYGFYAQEELRWKDLILRLGARYGETSHDITRLGGAAPGDDSASWDKFLWSGGLRYNLLPSMALYANVGTSFVAPSLKSVGGTLNPADRGVAGRNGQLPNPDLKPEEGTGYDLGVDIEPLKGLHLGARGFYNLVDDQIVTVVVSDDPSQSQDINAGDTTTYGMELEVSHRPLDWLMWFANYTYTHSEIDNDTDPDQDGAEVPFVPEHMGNIGVRLGQADNWSASIYLHLAGSIYDSTSKSGRSEFDSYETLNAHLEKNLLARDTLRVGLFADLYNLTNNEFEMPWQFQDPGFAATGGVKVVF